MAKGVKKVLGVVAAIAIPFVAPVVAGAIGISSTLGTAVVGAGLGAANAAITGGDPLLGAVTGGLGTFAAGGGFQNMFGGSQPLVAGQQAVGGGLFGGPGMTTGTPLAQQAGYTAGGAQSLLPPAATATGTGAGLAGAGAGFLEAGAQAGAQTALQSGISALSDPSTLARITLLAASGNVTGLSAAEEELVNLRKQELQQIAATNQELFDQQVSAARNFMQMAAQNAPNPQQAFAETKIATERQLAEQTRGLGASEAAAAQRRAAIRGTQTGATAAAAEEARGRGTQTQLMQAGIGALPTSAPEGYAGLALPMYEDLADRARQARSDLVYGVTRAAPNLFGGIA
jgi:hypothetical protein